jgi:signal transduction histidine kinase
MDPKKIPASSNVLPEFLSGGGEMGQRIRDFDWSKTALGPVNAWPQSLRTCVRIMLTSRQPIWIGWGRELIKLYNDPYIAIVSGKHPHALGKPAVVVWKDIWRDIEPMLKKVMDEDEGTYVESQLLIMERNGYPEETYYTFSYTPIPGNDGGPAGMICVNTDNTDRIISERQLRTLTQLGKKLTNCQTNKEVIENTIASLKENQNDFPYALFYSIKGDKIIFSQATDPDVISTVPAEIGMYDNTPFTRCLRESLLTRKPQQLDDVETHLGVMPNGAWPTSSNKAIILPIVQASSKEPYGILIIGTNPYRLFNEKYSSFFSLVTDLMATSFADVHVLEEERKRSEALAEIDRAKTIFFSNISHEFRTPLTLLLAPIEDALHDSNISEEHKIRMNVAYRNALRMQKLVNTLLEFSRLEAGRVEGRFSRVDIRTFTEDLASLFRSAIEKAGMQLIINKGDVHDAVYVDIDMWERIILNLISNAFKYSKEGTISLNIQQKDKDVYVSVCDTGVGIPEDQLDKIFNRFHRIENTEGRSQEGTGIGLAMVRELVKLHHGTIHVTSKPGKGSTFTVKIPVGKEHLPADKIQDTPAEFPLYKHSAAFVQEALKWMPEERKQISVNEDAHAGNMVAGKIPEYKVLLADDNADMQDYLYRLLSDQFTVITASDGEEAFNKALEGKPDLLLSDIMMPKLDGFGLLKKLRNHTETQNIPVIFLSARAGEEAKVEGLDAGAVDYLVKPFSAKELIARISSHISEKKYRQLSEELEAIVQKRTKELQRSNDDLLQFAHVASHDLKEPVRKFKTFIGRLQEEYENILPEKGKDYLRRMQIASDRMSAMIEGVLQYSSLNGIDQVNTNVNLNEIIKSIEADLEVIIHQKKVEIIKDELPVIDGMPVLIYQLFYNLINNSLKFSKENPVIRISSSVEVVNERQYAKIMVADNGIGFGQEHATKIFDAFSRLNTKDKYEGTGLGLALCKKIVERHHGSISATGEEGKGAVFTVLLPI